MNIMPHDKPDEGHFNQARRQAAMPSRLSEPGELVVLDREGTPVRFEVTPGKAWVFLTELVALCGFKRFHDIRYRLLKKGAVRKSTADKSCTTLQSNVADVDAVVALLERSQKGKAVEVALWLRDEVVPALLGRTAVEPAPEVPAREDEPTDDRTHRIPFAGGEVFAIEAEGKPWVVLKPAIEALGLAYSKQLQKLKARSWACMSLRYMQLPGDTQRREHVVVDVRTLLMLLATVNENNVSPERRPVLIAYQCEFADVVEAYLTKGVAVNPRHAASVGRASEPSTEPLLQAVARVEDLVARLVSRDEARERELRIMRDKLDVLAGGPEWTTVAEHARRHGLETGTRGLSRLAAKAREVAHEHGLVPLVSESVGLPPVVHLPDWVWAEAAERSGLGPERKAG